jgi:hypothetical protein
MVLVQKLVATRQLVRPQQPHLEPGQQGLLIRGGQSKSRAHAPNLEKSAGRCPEKSDYLLILQDIIDHHDMALFVEQPVRLTGVQNHGRVRL